MTATARKIPHRSPSHASTKELRIKIAARKHPSCWKHTWLRPLIQEVVRKDLLNFCQIDELVTNKISSVNKIALIKSASGACQLQRKVMRTSLLSWEFHRKELIKVIVLSQWGLVVTKMTTTSCSTNTKKIWYSSKLKKEKVSREKILVAYFHLEALTVEEITTRWTQMMTMALLMAPQTTPKNQKEVQMTKRTSNCIETSWLSNVLERISSQWKTITIIYLTRKMVWVQIKILTLFSITKWSFLHQKQIQPRPISDPSLRLWSMNLIHNKLYAKPTK